MSIHIQHATTKRTYHLHSIPPSKYIGVGEGEPYQIRIGNERGRKAGVRITIDGIDILTGKPGDLDPRGQMWMVEPHSSATISAWPESSSEGAQFVFGRANNAVATHIGDGTNVGIIACAYFREGCDGEDVFRSGSVLRGGATRGGLESMTMGTGAGSTIAQDIRTVRGFREPEYTGVIEVIHYTDRATLRTMIDAYASAGAASTWRIPGFPGASPRTSPIGINLGSTPRVVTAAPADPWFD